MANSPDSRNTDGTAKQAAPTTTAEQYGAVAALPPILQAFIKNHATQDYCAVAMRRKLDEVTKDVRKNVTARGHKMTGDLTHELHKQFIAALVNGENDTALVPRVAASIVSRCVSEAHCFRQHSGFDIFGAAHVTRT